MAYIAEKLSHVKAAFQKGGPRHGYSTETVDLPGVDNRKGRAPLRTRLRVSGLGDLGLTQPEGEASALPFIIKIRRLCSGTWAMQGALQFLRFIETDISRRS